MALTARRAARLTAEQVWGTYDTETPDFAYVLESDAEDFFEINEVADFVQRVSYRGGGSMITSRKVRERYEGQFNLPLYAAQHEKLLSWAFEPVNAAKTVPWPTDQCEGDLASVTADVRRKQDCANTEFFRYLGVKPTGTVTLAGESGGLWRLGGSCMAKTRATITGTDFPEPGTADYPTLGTEWAFHHISSLDIGSVRTGIRAISIAAEYFGEQNFNESLYLQTLRHHRRQITITVDLDRKASPDDLATYLAGTEFDVVLTLNNGTDTIEFDFGAKCILTPGSGFQRQIPIEGGRMANLLNITVQEDSTLTSTRKDLQLTFS